MKPFALRQALGLCLLVLQFVVTAGMEVFAQAPPPHTSGSNASTNTSTFIFNGPNGPVRITSQGPIHINGQLNQQPPNRDLFNSLVSSSASIDMDSPVTAQAVFDPPTIAAGGRSTYRIVLNALDESVKMPDKLPIPSGLEYSLGGRAQNYEPTGGQKMRPQTTINYHITASATGSYTMPPITVIAYGKPVTIPEAHLEVVPPGTPGVRDATRLLVDLPRGDIYPGQMIKVPIMLIESPDNSIPAMSQAKIIGDAIFSEPTGYGQRREVIRYGGEAYPALIQDVTFTPMRDGDQTLVAQANCVGIRPIPGQPGAMQSFSTLVDSDPVTLKVKPLPVEGRLPGFTGAIGEFQVESPRLSTNVVTAGEPLTLTVVIRGEGNLGRITPPQLPLLRDWQSFPPISDLAPPGAIQQRGFAVFNYTLIPLSERSKSTPAIPFSYFNPSTTAYVDATIPPVPVTVHPAIVNGVAAVQAPQPVSPGGGDQSSRGERELAMTGLAESPGTAVATLEAVQLRGWFVAMQIVPAFILCGLVGWSRRQRYLQMHPEVIRKRRARRGLRRSLTRARAAAAARDAVGFASSAVSALREACAPAGAANPDALVCADILRELRAHEQSGRPGEIVRQLFSSADSLRYGGKAHEEAAVLALKPEFEEVLDLLRARL